MANVDLRNPVVQKALLSLLVAAGVLGVFYFTHLLPFGYPAQSERIDALKADYEKKAAELARARATVADLPRFEAEYDQLHERWTTAAELLPTDRQMAALLRKITLSAQETGCQFVVFRPSSPRTETYYTEMPLQLQVNGGYHQVGSFLAELANMRRIITVGNLHLRQNAQTKGDDGLTTTADCVASAYSLNSSPAPAAPAPTGKKGGAANAHKSS
ncbi:MAG TPA: type 4a pilus biogenesis protein PilO [Candidatus Sulfotelmatobacter sp.]|nr:type 4a pilus biogenesis protein PilO [Candidatus Sulfotelmatobacter sp.]